MVTPTVEVRRYTANQAAVTTLPPLRHDLLVQAREAFPSLDAMTLLELEADRHDH